MRNDTNQEEFKVGYFVPPREGERIDCVDKGRGMVSNALNKAIAYERTPALFDESEITDRDESLRLQELKEADVELCIERVGKPVVLSDYQDRLVKALSYFISQDIDKEDVKAKIEAPYRQGRHVERSVSIDALSNLIFGSCRAKYRDRVVKELYALSKIRQVQAIVLPKECETGKKHRLTYPLINLGAAIEEVNSKGVTKTIAIGLTFGGLFFYRLKDRYAVITPKYFEVCRQKGRGTELFRILLSDLLSKYGQFRYATNKAEQRVREEHKRDKSYPEEKLAMEIAQAKRKALTCELNFDKIKNRVRTDYDSTRFYKNKFKQDLLNAIEGLKELGLIEDGRITKGVRGQDKAVFVFSETYNDSTPQEAETTPTFLPKSEDDFSPF